MPKKFLYSYIYINDKYMIWHIYTTIQKFEVGKIFGIFGFIWIDLLKYNTFSYIIYYTF